jgi:hypothetical protein
VRKWDWHQARLSQLVDCSDGWAEAERKRSVDSRQAAVAAFEEKVTAVDKQIGDLTSRSPVLAFSDSRSTRPKRSRAWKEARRDAGECESHIASHPDRDLTEAGLVYCPLTLSFRAKRMGTVSSWPRETLRCRSRERPCMSG